jgi:hypothetical protein
MDSLKNMTSKLKKREDIPEVKVSPPKTSVEEVTEEDNDFIQGSSKVSNPRASDYISDGDRQAFLESLKSIKSDRKEYGTPTISKVGLQTPVEEQLKASPLMHKPSISNLLEDTMGLFDDDPTGIDDSDDYLEQSYPAEIENSKSQEPEIKLSDIN